jgi:signal transduction histidine kinase
VPGERAWCEAQLAALARDLTHRVEPYEVAATVIEHGVRLLRADSGSVSVRDGVRRLYRLLAVAGPGAPAGAEATAPESGRDVPEDMPIVDRLTARPTLVLPDDAPEEQPAESSIVYAVMRHGGAPLGILGFVRGRERPFGARERALVRALADQAALALHTATLLADLRLANRLKSQFVSTMSHELRTPLTVILGFAEMARDPSVGAAERDECLERLEEAGRELLGLIEATLEIGKLEAGRADLQLETVELPALWTHLGQLLGRMPRPPAVALEWSTEVPAVSMVTDARKILIVVRNLVDNALKFTEQGTVRVEACLDAEENVVVRVSDTGIGIPPADHETVFEMFRQADGSDSRRYGGIGLGLYIVRRFVEQLGGTIALASRPGEGSVFAVTLPRAEVAVPVECAA